MVQTRVEKIKPNTQNRGDYYNVLSVNSSQHRRRGGERRSGKEIPTREFAENHRGEKKGKRGSEGKGALTKKRGNQSLFCQTFPPPYKRKLYTEEKTMRFLQITLWRI